MPLQPLEDMLILKGDTVLSLLTEEIRPILVPARIIITHVSQAEMECEKCRKIEIVCEIQSAQKNLAGLWQCTAPKPFEIGTPNFLGILLWSLIRSGQNFTDLPHENSPLRSI